MTLIITLSEIIIFPEYSAQTNVFKYNVLLITSEKSIPTASHFTLT